MQTNRHAADYSALLQKSWQIFRTHFKDLIVIVLITFVLFGIVVAVVTAVMATLFGTSLAVTGDYWNAGLTAAAIISGIVVAVVAVLAYSLPLFLVTRLTQKHLSRQPIDLVAETKAALPHLPAFVGTILLATLLLLPLFLLLVIPGIIFMIFWLFITQEMVLRQQYGMSALVESKRLVSGRWWQVFGYMLLTWVILMVMVGAVESVTESLLSSKLSELLSGFLTMLTTVFASIFGTVFFLQLEHSSADRHGSAKKRPHGDERAEGE